MRRLVCRTLLALAVCHLWPELAGAAVPLEPPPRSIVIESVSIVDTVRGEAVGPRTIVVSDGKITAIEPPETAAASSAEVRIDGRGLYLMPGLVDMHVHLFNNATARPPNEWAFPLFIFNGVTAVREMAAKPRDLATVERWRAAVRNGELVAPHVLAAGVSVGMPSEASVRQQVREARAAGGDFVKVFSRLPQGEWQAIVDEAHAARMPVCGHVPAGTGAVDAAKGGLRSNEHLTRLYEACSTAETPAIDACDELHDQQNVETCTAQEREVLNGFNQQLCAQAAAAVAETGQLQVPTLVLAAAEAGESATDFQDDVRWQYLRRDEQERWQRILTRALSPDRELADARLKVSTAIVQTLHRGGVPIAAGTDAPMPLVYPGFALHKELELLVEAGLTPADALRAATIRPAEFLHLSDTIGSIETGKRADLVLLRANPLQEIRNTQMIDAVILNGRLLRRADLDALLR